MASDYKTDYNQNIGDFENIEPGLKLTPTSARRSNVMNTIINQLPLNTKQLNAIKKELTPDSIQLHNNINYIRHQLKSRGVFETIEPNYHFYNHMYHVCRNDASTSFDRNFNVKDETTSISDDEVLYKMIRYDNRDYSQCVNMSNVSIFEDSLDSTFIPKIEVNSDKDSYNAGNYFQVSDIPRDMEIPTTYFDNTRSTNIFRQMPSASTKSTYCRCHDNCHDKLKASQTVYQHQNTPYYQGQQLQEVVDKYPFEEVTEYYENAIKEQRNKRCKYYHQSNRSNPTGIAREYIPRSQNPFECGDCLIDQPEIANENSQNDDSSIETKSNRIWKLWKQFKKNRDNQQWLETYYQTTEEDENRNLSRGWRGKFNRFLRSLCFCTYVKPD